MQPSRQTLLATMHAAVLTSQTAPTYFGSCTVHVHISVLQADCAQFMYMLCTVMLVCACDTEACPLASKTHAWAGRSVACLQPWLQQDKAGLFACCRS